MRDGNGTSRLDRIEAILEKHTEQIGLLLQHGQRTNDFLGRMAEAQVRMAEAQVIMSEDLAKMAEAQVKMADAQVRMAEDLVKMAEDLVKLVRAQNRLEIAQAETTEKLNALIAIVDDWIRRNGGWPPERKM